MSPDDFHPDALPTGKHAFHFDLETPGGESAPMPVLLAVGASPGKTLVALAGVHGDEYEGVRTLHDLFASLDPQTMHGRFLAVPIANVLAYRAGTRTTPDDGLNLARVFPGNPSGSITERIADCLTRHIIRHADLLIDLHSGGIKYQFPALVGYDARATPAGAASRAAALAMGFPVVWGHPTLSPGRTLTAAAERGIPWLYTEATGAGRIADDDLRLYTSGLRNLLTHLGILSGIPTPATPHVHIMGEGDIDRVATFTRHGFFVPAVRLLDAVRPGQLLGCVRDLVGATVEEVHAVEEGIVVMLHAFPVVAPGDSVCVLARPEPEC